MKKSYLSPNSLFVAVASADVITASATGVGVIFNWDDEPGVIPTSNLDEMN